MLNVFILDFPFSSVVFFMLRRDTLIIKGKAKGIFQEFTEDYILANALLSGTNFFKKKEISC